MLKADELNLCLTAEAMEAHCRGLVRQIPNAGRALAMLTGLQGLLASMVPSGNHALPSYRAIMKVIENHALAARERLLDENVTILTQAMGQMNRQEIARAHASMSRNGFQEVVRRAARQLPPEQLSVSVHWMEAWCGDASARGREASGYPDALDLIKAGVHPGEYAAMMDALFSMAAE